MEKLRLCLVILTVAVSSKLSLTENYDWHLESPGKPTTPPHTSGNRVRIHSCNQNQTTCMASGNGHYNSPNTKLARLIVGKGTPLVVCFQIKYNGSKFALKVISRNQVVFQKLMPGKDCTISPANKFERKVKWDEKVDPDWNPFQLISQKPGLPDDAKFLAVNWNHPNESKKTDDWLQRLTLTLNTDSEDDYRTVNDGSERVLFRTTFTRTIILNLLI